MAKQDKAVAVTSAASLAARAMARLEKAAAEVHADEDRRERSLQLVSTGSGFNAVIWHGKTLIEISGDDFAVRQE